jgi:hypothetical protein
MALRSRCGSSRDRRTSRETKLRGAKAFLSVVNQLTSSCHWMNYRLHADSDANPMRLASKAKGPGQASPGRGDTGV